MAKEKEWGTSKSQELTDWKAVDGKWYPLEAPPSGDYQKWQYLILFESKNTQVQIHAAGEAGWELVGISTNTVTFGGTGMGSNRYYFKRPKVELAPPGPPATSPSDLTTPIPEFDLATPIPEVPSRPRLPGWMPTHQVPNEGLIGEATKGQGGRATQLPGGSQVRLEERDRLWAKVTDGYGGTFWVNGEKLIPLR